jgi:hypothetical protein
MYKVTLNNVAFKVVLERSNGLHYINKYGDLGKINVIPTRKLKNKDKIMINHNYNTLFGISNTNNLNDCLDVQISNLENNLINN